MKVNRKTTSLDPSEVCSSCGAELRKDEYDICTECESALGVGDEQERKRKLPEKPDDWN